MGHSKITCESCGYTFAYFMEPSIGYEDKTDWYDFFNFCFCDPNLFSSEFRNNILDLLDHFLSFRFASYMVKCPSCSTFIIFPDGKSNEAQFFINVSYARGFF